MCVRNGGCVCVCVCVCVREIECERVCLSLSVCVLVDPAKKDRCDELNFRSVARASVTTMSLETSDGVCSYTPNIQRNSYMWEKTESLHVYECLIKGPAN